MNDPTSAASRRVRVVVVDDHHLLRAGVRAELLAHCDVVGEAAAPAAAVAAIAATRPDAVLLDVHLPDGGGLAVLEALRDGAGAPVQPPPAVLALSVSDAAEDVVPMIRAGALGYVTKTIDTTELVAAITRVAAGDAYFSPRLAAFVLQAFSAPVAPHDAGDDDDGAADVDAARARGPAPPRPRLPLQADRRAPGHQRADRRDARRRGAAQAAAQLAPRGEPLGRLAGSSRTTRRRRRSPRQTARSSNASLIPSASEPSSSRSARTSPARRCWLATSVEAETLISEPRIESSSTAMRSIWS